MREAYSGSEREKGDGDKVDACDAVHLERRKIKIR